MSAEGSAKRTFGDGYTEVKGSVHISDAVGPVNIGGQMCVLQTPNTEQAQKKEALLERKRQILSGLKSALVTYHGDEKSSFFPLPWNEESEKLNLEDNYISACMYQANKAGLVDKNAQPMNLDQVFAKLPKADRLLMIADAGFGKTTLCRKIAHDWARNKPYMSQFVLVFVVPLHNLKSEASVNQWILDSFKDECDLTDVPDDELIDAVSSVQEDVLWIMDGYDEVPKSCLDTFIKVIEKKSSIFLNEATMIVTTRPENADSIALAFRKKLIIKGFSREEQALFIDKFFENDESPAKEDLKNLLWCNMPEMEAIGQSPLLLYLLCNYQNFIDEKQERIKIRTKSDIYDIILNSLVKLSAKKNQYIKSKKESCLEKEKLYTILLPLGEFYSQLWQENTIRFTLERAKAMLKENMELLFVGIFKQEVRAHFGKKKTWFRPYHQSFVEYLIALFCENATQKGLHVPNCIHYGVRDFGSDLMNDFFQELVIIATDATIIIRSIDLNFYLPVKQDRIIAWLNDRLSEQHLLVAVTYFPTNEKVYKSYQSRLYAKLGSGSTNFRNNHYCMVKWMNDSIEWEDLKQHPYDELYHRRPDMMDTIILSNRYVSRFHKLIMDWVNQRELMEMCLRYSERHVDRLSQTALNLFLNILSEGAVSNNSLRDFSSLSPSQKAFAYLGTSLFSEFESISGVIAGIEMYFETRGIDWMYPEFMTRKSMCSFLKNPYREYPVLETIINLMLCSCVQGLKTAYGEMRKAEAGNCQVFHLLENSAWHYDACPTIYSLTSIIESEGVPLTAYFYSKVFQSSVNHFFLIMKLLLEKQGHRVEVLPPEHNSCPDLKDLFNKEMGYLSVKRISDDPLQYFLHITDTKFHAYF